MSHPFARKMPFGGMALIRRIVTKGAGATVSFLSIPQTFSDLYFTFSARDTATGSGLLGLSLQINGDASSGSYTAESFVDALGSGSASSNDAATSAGNVCGLVAGTLSLAGAFGTGYVSIQDYAGIVYPKMILGSSAAYYSGPNIRTRTCAFVWKGVDSVRSAVFTTAGTAFADGSKFSMYGIG